MVNFQTTRNKLSLVSTKTKTNDVDAILCSKTLAMKRLGNAQPYITHYNQNAFLFLGQKVDMISWLPLLGLINQELIN